jgi:hypothetical protein
LVSARSLARAAPSCAWAARISSGRLPASSSARSARATSSSRARIARCSRSSTSSWRAITSPARTARPGSTPAHRHPTAGLEREVDLLELDHALVPPAGRIGAPAPRERERGKDPRRRF